MLFEAHPYGAVIGLLIIFALGAIPAFFGTSVWLAFLFSFLECPAAVKDVMTDFDAPDFGDDTHEPA